MSSDRAIPRRSPAVVLLCAVVLASITVLSYWAWIGAAEIPYPAWRVVGCALTLLVLASVAGARVRLWLPVAVMPLALTVAWSVPAARTDETGLWGVGAVLLLLGSLMGAFVILAVTAIARQWLSERADRE